jgi:hypothetical protein
MPVFPLVVYYESMMFPLRQVYLQQNKKKAEAEGKNCHAKTMFPLARHFFFPGNQRI